MSGKRYWFVSIALAAILAGLLWFVTFHVEDAKLRTRLTFLVIFVFSVISLIRIKAARSK